MVANPKHRFSRGIGPILYCEMLSEYFGEMWYSLKAKKLKFGFSHPSDHHYGTDTVKPVLSSHSKIYKTKVIMENGSLMKVKSIAECSPWSIQQ